MSLTRTSHSGTSADTCESVSPDGVKGVGTGATVCIEGLTKKYALTSGGNLTVFSDLNLRIESGSFVAILGPSGCGKSTLLRMIAGLDTPDAGSIRLLAPARDVYPHVGLMLQHYPSLPWLSVARNVELALDHRSPSKRALGRQRAAYYLSRVGLSGWENAYPRELSGGMLQRLALARTLAMNPAAVLLDEPLGALDALTRHILKCLIRDLHKDEPRTYIMVTHDPDEALDLASRMIVLGPAGAGILYDSDAAAAPLDRDGLVQILRGTIMTFAAGTWSGFNVVRKSPAGEGKRGYDLWLGMSDQQRVDAVRANRVAGAFFTLPALVPVIEMLADLDPVIVHAFSQPESPDICEHVLTHPRSAQARQRRWALPGPGLEMQLLREIDPEALSTRVTEYEDRAECVRAVARGDADACVTDVRFAWQTLSWRDRLRLKLGALNLEPLPERAWRDLWTVLVVPRQLLETDRDALRHAVRALGDDSSSAPSRLRTHVRYLDARTSSSVLRDGTMTAAYRRWGGDGPPTVDLFPDTSI